jgi:hypothetical protein
MKIDTEDKIILLCAAAGVEFVTEGDDAKRKCIRLALHGYLDSRLLLTINTDSGFKGHVMLYKINRKGLAAAEGIE